MSDKNKDGFVIAAEISAELGYDYTISADIVHHFDEDGDGKISRAGKNKCAKQNEHNRDALT